jgi:predicted regulator of amino acid metabolism with ACT domain
MSGIIRDRVSLNGRAVESVKNTLEIEMGRVAVAITNHRRTIRDTAEKIAELKERQKVLWCAINSLRDARRLK